MPTLTPIQTLGPAEEPSLTIWSGSLGSPTGGSGPSSLVVLVTTSGAVTNPQVASVTLGGGADNFVKVVDAGGAGSFGGAIWVDPDCTPGLSNIVVNCTGGSGAGAEIYVTVYEVPGVLAPDKFSVGNGVESGNPVWSSGATGNLSHPNEILVGVATSSIVVLTVTGTGTYTTANTPAGTYDQTSGYQVVSSAAPAAFSGSNAPSSGGYTALLATFYQAPLAKPAQVFEVGATAVDGTWGQWFSTIVVNNQTSSAVWVTTDGTDAVVGGAGNLVVPAGKILGFANRAPIPDVTNSSWPGTTTVSLISGGTGEVTVTVQ